MPERRFTPRRREKLPQFLDESESEEPVEDPIEKFVRTVRGGSAGKLAAPTVSTEVAAPLPPGEKPKRAPVTLAKRLEWQRKSFEQLGFIESRDVGFTPVLTEQSRLSVLAIPPDLRDEALLEWARNNNALLGIQHALFLSHNKAGLLKKIALPSGVVHFFGTAYSKGGGLFYSPVFKTGTPSSIRLDPDEPTPPNAQQ
jgi:hypothetical protein